MERRGFMAAMGTVTAAQAFPLEANAAESMHPARYKAPEASTAHCVSAGEGCLRHCLGMLRMRDTSMVACADVSYQMITACGALRTAASVNVPAFARGVAQVCVDCQKECAKFPDVECKACGASCETGGAECRRVAA